MGLTAPSEVVRHTAGDVGGQVRFHGAELLAVKHANIEAFGCQLPAEPPGNGQFGLIFDDENTSGLVPLDVESDLMAEPCKHGLAQHGQAAVETGHFVVDQDKPLAPARGPRSDPFFFDHPDLPTGLGQIVGNGGADHPAADDHRIDRFSSGFSELPFRRSVFQIFIQRELAGLRQDAPGNSAGPTKNG